MTQTVIISKNTCRDCYHTEECREIPQRTREVSIEMARDKMNLKLCSFCSGDWEAEKIGRKNSRKGLRQMLEAGEIEYE